MISSLLQIRDLRRPLCEQADAGRPDPGHRRRGREGRPKGPRHQPSQELQGQGHPRRLPAAARQREC